METMGEVAQGKDLARGLEKSLEPVRGKDLVKDNQIRFVVGWEGDLIQEKARFQFCEDL